MFSTVYPKFENLYAKLEGIKLEKYKLSEIEFGLIYINNNLIIGNMFTNISGESLTFNPILELFYHYFKLNNELEFSAIVKETIINIVVSYGYYIDFFKLIFIDYNDYNFVKNMAKGTYLNELNNYIVSSVEKRKINVNYVNKLINLNMKSRFFYNTEDTPRNSITEENIFFKNNTGGLYEILKILTEKQIILHSLYNLIISLLYYCIKTYKTPLCN